MQEVPANEAHQLTPIFTQAQFEAWGLEYTARMQTAMKGYSMHVLEIELRNQPNVFPVPCEENPLLGVTLELNVKDASRLQAYVAGLDPPPPS